MGDIETVERRGQRVDAPNLQNMISVAEAAERLQVSEQTIRRWAREGRLEGVLKARGRTSPMRIPEASVNKFLLEEMQPVAEGATES